MSGERLLEIDTEGQSVTVRTPQGNVAVSIRRMGEDSMYRAGELGKPGCSGVRLQLLLRSLSPRLHPAPPLALTFCHSAGCLPSS